jgi:hypothetical protein
VPDDHDNFALTMPDYAIYEISRDGEITINGHGYPVPKHDPASFKGGFHVLVVNRRTLQPISDSLYKTNDDLGGQLRMSLELKQLAAARREGGLLFLATVGDPIGTAQLPEGSGARTCPGSGGSYTVEPFSAACTYGPIGSRQTFVVPHDVMPGYPLTSLKVDLRGAYGGYAESSGGSGGDGDQVDGDLEVGTGKSVTPGQTLSVMVGGAGTIGGHIYGGAGGFNGGGEGGSSCGICRGWPGGGGGGASDIRTLSPADPGSLASRLAVAGGGGGGGGNSSGGHGGHGGAGGRSGGASGGGAGTSSAGGRGGFGEGLGAQSAESGRLAFGGRGATNGNSVILRSAGSGGGGGGGYYGGGGGATGDKAATHGGGGGGGGSNLVPAGGTVKPIADQEKDRVPPKIVIHYATTYGPTLAQLLLRFGATPTLIDGLKDSPRYALVGALTPAADLDAGSFDAPEASPEIKRGATGALQGVLQRGRRNMWYGPAAENLPATRGSNGHQGRPSVVNYGFYNVISRVSKPWPVPAGGPATHGAEAKAFHLLSRDVCACDDIRSRYNLGQNTIASWKEKMENVAFKPGEGFDDATFARVKAQLGTELGDVYVVDGLKDGLGRLLTNDQLTLGHALSSAYHNVREGLELDKGTHVLSIINFVVELVSAVAEEIPGVGPAIGIVSAAMTLGSELANEPDGTSFAALRTTVAKLNDNAADGFTAALSTLSQTFDYVYSDWGKLSAVADGLTGPDAEGWDVSAADSGRYVRAMSNAIALSYYRALIPIVYGTFEGQGAPTADTGKWCNDFDGCLFEHFKAPSSAYSFPVRDPYQGYASAHDNIVLGRWPLAKEYQPPFSHYYWKASEPFPQELLDKVVRAGLYRPYLFVRWPVQRVVCPGTTWTTLKATRQPFSGKCSPG